MLTTLPGNAGRLHAVSQGDVIRPDVELPLAQPQHPTVHSATVYTDSHVEHIHPRHVTHQSAPRQQRRPAVAEWQSAPCTVSQVLTLY